MKKATWWIIILLAAIILAVIYLPQDEAAKSADVVINTVKDSANEVDDEIAEGLDELEDTAEEIGEEIEEDIDEAAEEVDEAIDSDADADDEIADDTDEPGEADGETTTTLNGYIEYTPEEFDAARAAGKNVALFFWASRCPSCKGLQDNIDANMDQFDENTVLFKVDYDVEEDFKTKYNVTSQHTIVYVDENAEPVKVARGAATLKQVLENY